MNYFGKGLDDFFNSIKKCSIDPSNNNYCNQFNEFINKYMVVNTRNYLNPNLNVVPTNSKSGKDFFSRFNCIYLTSNSSLYFHQILQVNEFVCNFNIPVYFQYIYIPLYFLPN
ncbi:hypothetical protein PVBG_05350 [Plasmodium vivax Brazil I]|uniref:Uncharacterized protein n=1 Tax=Plasmodium vivax (strain Brazil I) TaxID=1033975 RepID=A0A0J9VI89_PLAV1|nr:hypothetical protein PVBG_05350 [Plasmodium vivax Brazil I]